MLRNNKHTGIETSTTRRLLYHSLSKQLIHFLLDNGKMNCSCLNIEVLEIMEQGKTRPVLKMVTLDYIKHKPVGSNAPQLIQKWESVSTCITEKKMMMRLCTVAQQECWPPWLLFFLESVELAETVPIADFLPPWWASFLLSKWSLFPKEVPLDCDTGLSCTLKWNPVIVLALPLL